MNFPLRQTALAAALLWVGAASAVQQYAVTDLGTLGGWNSWATGVNNSGQVVGNIQYYPTGDGTTIAAGFLYANGEMNPLTYSTPDSSGVYLALHRNRAAYAINNAGQIAGGIEPSGWSAMRIDGNGGASAGGQGLVATITQNGTSSFIYGPGGSVSLAYAINASGNIAGVAVNNNPDLFHGSDQAAAWSNGTWTMLSGYYSSARGINDAGTVVGVTGNGQSFINGVQLDNTLGGANSSTANDINNLGVIVGTGRNAIGWENAYTYTVAGGMVNLGQLIPNTTGDSGQNFFSRGLAISDTGAVVGMGSTIFNNVFGNHAFLYTEGGGMMDLNGLLRNTSTLDLTAATAISDNGMYIAGYGRSSIDGQEHAFLLTAVPEPETWVMLLAGLGLLGTFARRNRYKIGL